MTSPASVTGSCHCGKVHYAVHGNIVSVVNCHCGLCRSLSGAAFTSYIVVRAPDFRVERGQESVANYAATPKATKHFCIACGTPLFNTNPIDYPSLVMVYLGTAAATIELTPRVNVYRESMLPWVDRVDGIKSFSQAAVRGA